MFLEKWQRNSIFKAITDAGLDPTDSLTDAGDEARIHIGGTGSMFVIARDDSGAYRMHKGVGDGPLSRSSVSLWTTVEERFATWLKDVKRDQETPDLFAEPQQKWETLTSEPVQQDAADLGELVASVTDSVTRDYLEEAIKCLQVGARRAAVVFLWTGAVSAIRSQVWQHGAASIQTALQRHNPIYRFTKKDDFWKVKDDDLLQITQDLGVYDQSQKKRLKEALDLRNDCGHPVKYKPGDKKVASFIEDIVGIVWP